MIGKHPHPFCTRKFKTDGRTVFAEVYDESGEKSLLELTKSQHYFEKIIAPYLQGLEFKEDVAVRWWPMGTRRTVVIDPLRSFGQPIVSDRGIPTSVLAQAVYNPIAKTESTLQPLLAVVQK